jgi:hypothetical protein
MRTNPVIEDIQMKHSCMPQKASKRIYRITRINSYRDNIHVQGLTGASKN